MIRKATPHDVEAIVAAIYEAGHEFLPWLFGANHRRIIHELAISESSSFSWTNTYIYEHHGKTAGVVICYPSKLESEMDKGTHRIFRHYMGFWELFWFIRRARKAVRYFVKPSNSYYILALAVFTEFRGQGIAGKLLEYVASYAHKGNYSLLALEVENNNHSAIRSYQKNGFTIAGGVPLKRFSRKLARKSKSMLLLRRQLAA